MKRFPNPAGKIIAVRLGDGTVLSVSDLPDPRGVMSTQRKAKLIRCLAMGLISEDELLARYEMSREELRALIRFYEKGRESGFKRPFDYNNPRSVLARERRAKIREMRDADPNVTVHELAKATGLSASRVHQILRESEARE